MLDKVFDIFFEPAEFVVVAVLIRVGHAQEIAVLDLDDFINTVRLDMLSIELDIVLEFLDRGELVLDSAELFDEGGKHIGS